MSLRKKARIIKFHCSDFQPEIPWLFFSLISDNMVDYMAREILSLVKTKNMPDRNIFLSFPFFEL